MEAWTRWHAALLLISGALAAAVRTPALIAPVAAVSFASLIWQEQERHTPFGRFGAANVVTAIRILLVFVLLAGQWPSLTVALVLGLLLGLDGVDGELARRQGLVSPFGARFDEEADALTVLTAALLLFATERAPAVVLLAGFLRYSYVLARALTEQRRGEEPRSLLARSAYAVTMVGLIAAFALEPPESQYVAVLATGVMSASFARSFWWAFGPLPRGSSGIL